MIRQNMSQTDGVSLIELLISMGIGGILISGVLNNTQMIHRFTKEFRDTSEYQSELQLISGQFQGTALSDCERYLPTSVNPNIQTSTVGATTHLNLLKDPLPASEIRISSAGTSIGRNLYFFTLTTTDNACDADKSKSCLGTLALEMNPPSSPPPSSGPKLKFRSQEIAHITFSIDSSNHLISCGLKSGPFPGEIIYRNCIFPPNSDPSKPSQTAPSGVMNSCPAGWVAVGACAAMMDEVRPPPPPAPPPPKTYQAAYCRGDPNPVSGIACCPLKDPKQLAPSTPTGVWECNPQEVVTGVCSSDPNPAGDITSTDTPPSSDDCISGKVMCSKILDLSLLNIPNRYCYDVWLNPGTLGKCNHREVMTGYCGPLSGCGRTRIKCCTVFP